MEHDPVAATARPLRREDLPAVATLLGQTRAAGGIAHPGGTQWWLRLLGTPGFAAFVWEHEGALTAFALIDGETLVAESDASGPSLLEQVDWAEAYQRATGKDALEVTVVGDDPLRATLTARGYRRSGAEVELMTDAPSDSVAPRLPSGSAIVSLDDITDDAYIELHRAAWSDTRPSTYRRELHEAVTSMPQFRRDLVTVVTAPNGEPAAYCIGWADRTSRTLEIEPLGTHRDHRRLGLARAVVGEIVRRAARGGMRSVLVWSDPEKNPVAYSLYTSSGLSPRRQLVRLRRTIA